MLLFFGPLGGQEILVIILIALLMFGPKKIPEIARTLGKGFREFKQSTSGLMDSINEEVKEVSEPVAKTPAQSASAQPTAAESAPPQLAAVNPPKPSVLDDVEETVLEFEDEDQHKADGKKD